MLPACASAVQCRADKLLMGAVPQPVWSRARHTLSALVTVTGWVEATLRYTSARSPSSNALPLVLAYTNKVLGLCTKVTTPVAGI